MSKYYGRHYNAEGIRQTAGLSKEGVSLLGISEAAEKIGFCTRGVQLTFEQLTKEARLPCILHWNQNHYVVLAPLTRREIRYGNMRVADPARGSVTFKKK